MNKIKRILTIFIAVLCLSNFVYAQDYDLFSGKFYDLKGAEEKIEFEYYNGAYSICENDKKTIPILVINKDIKTDNKYSLDVLGASWLSLSVKEFSLPKKQSGIVFLNLNPGQNIYGKYNVKVNSVSSVGNIKRNLSLEINIEKCYELSLELEKEEDKICGGTPKQYSGEIKNDGSKQAEIELIVDGPSWVSVDKNIFFVESNDKQIFELNANIPENVKEFFNIVAGAAIKNLPSIKSEKNLRIEIVSKYDCYKAAIISDEKIKNYYSDTYTTIKIRNNGIKKAIYEVSLEATNWISIEPKEITLNPEQLGNLNLHINPNTEVFEGNYPIKIIIKSDDTAYSKNINIILTNENKFLKGLKSFVVFYQYYIYLVLFMVLILFIFRRQISNKIRTAYKNYKIRKARLKALEAARKARQAKKKK